MRYCTFLLLLLLGCSYTKSVFAVIEPEREEKNIIIFRHVGTQTASVPTIIILPEPDILKHEIFNSHLKTVSVLEFDSISSYLSKKLPVLNSINDCQCEYTGEPGSYKITVINNGISTIYFLNCRKCTRTVFLNFKQELSGRKGIMNIIGNVFNSLIPI